MSLTRYIFFVFSLTAVLLCAVYLRRLNNNAFYRFREMYVIQNRLKQQLWQRQIQLDGLINPASIAERIEKSRSVSGHKR